MKTVLLLLLTGGILIFTGCKAKKMVTETSPEDIPFDPVDFRLHDIWVLVSMNGETLDRDLPRPRLELYPGEGRISGNGSCNDFFGQMEGQGQEIVFREIGTTKMFCRELMATESAFIDQLKAINNYRIEDLQLFLLNDQQETLVFQKVD